jgi:preprotein translocase SecF subunit
MIEIFRQPNYNFIGRRRWAYGVSGVMVVIALVSLYAHGLRYDLDFLGGTLIQVRFPAPVDPAALRAALTTVEMGESVIQEFGDPREYIIRAAHDTTDVVGRVETALRRAPSLGGFEIRRVEFVGPQVGDELQRQAVYAVIAAVVGILIYLGVRFDLKGGVAAVVAIVHDVIVCVGALSVTQREFSLPVLAALLTIVGYSVNDTIVAYDRLRETRTRAPRAGTSFARQMNDAINQTLSRTVLTAVTTFLASVVLFLFGGPTLEALAFVLTVGVLVGTYSTVYVAGALVVDWTLYVERRRGIRRPQRNVV